jgi:hypothetical protein
MKKVILTVAALGLAVLTVTEAQAGPFGWFRRGRPVYVQPAPAAAQAVVPAQTGVRAFSYEPATAAPVYRTYRTNTGGAAYINAINKSLGRGF